MPDLTQVALDLAAAFVLAITPGPRRLYVVARSLAGSRPDCVQQARRRVALVQGRTAARPGWIQRLREGRGGAMIALGIGRYEEAACHISLAPDRRSISPGWLLRGSSWIALSHLRSFRLADQCSQEAR
ncbi:hypothetical protein MES4922_10133 [Mesorhizobium ventifaucium]|uniref:Lasso peptide biosynthesis B2 protein n=1 Tax=Mesorhizobium ventifaucium TaxID=666020 RepID=A0ABM9DEL6_9HYPH|nr:hypothetical protein MES4922_10133 [Mesorhizobium ventifaucium]